MASGHLYRVGHDWFVDTALLQRAARRHVVEPMMDAYQILAPAGLVRCAPAQGLALPGQTGDLFRCQGQRAGHDVGARLRDLAADLGLAITGEWNVWPATAHAAADHACGCTACKAGGACGTEAPATSAPQTLAERLITSESLGTVTARRLTGENLGIYPSSRAPEWVCGRYHECIASIVRFPDVAADERIARVGLRGRTEITWDLVLDRQRRIMLQEILELVGRQLAEQGRHGSVAPARPPIYTPGYSAWAVAASTPGGTCAVCPYRLGTNLRCPACRRSLLTHDRAPVADQAGELADMLRDHDELQRLPRKTLGTLGAAIAASHAHNPQTPLTDAFYVRLERDVLAAAAPLGLSEATMYALVEVAELATLEPKISVGVAARRTA